MATTVLVAEATRNALASSRDRLGANSMDEAIRIILRQATPTAPRLSTVSSASPRPHRSPATP